MKKRIMLAVLCLSLGVSSTSFAAVKPDPGIVEIQGEECGNCGGLGTLRLEKTYGKWIKCGLVICDKEQKWDEEYYRDIVREYKCSKCGYKKKLTPLIEYKVVCNH